MTRRADVPERVIAQVETFAAAHDAVLPGVLRSVLITGSAVTGDWQEATSDIDLVLVVSRPLAVAEVEAIAPLHRAERTPLDGVYLTSEQVTGGPEAVISAPQAVGGALSRAVAGGQLTWVTWWEMEHALEGVVSTGGVEWMPSARRFTGVRDGLLRHSRTNLLSYWSALAEEGAARLEGRPTSDPVDATPVVWMALGASRLVLALETGRVASKSEAGRALAAERPDLAARCLRSRAGEAVRFTVADGLAAVEVVRACVAWARRFAPGGIRSGKVL